MSSSSTTPDYYASQLRSTAKDPFITSESAHPSTHEYRVTRITLQSSTSPINPTYPNLSPPPTPVPSPGPFMPESRPSDRSGVTISSIATTSPPTSQSLTAQAISWSSLAPDHLRHLPSSAIDSLFTSVLAHLTTAQLMHLASLLPTSFKRDFLAELPPEISLYILSFVDDVKTLARASCVSQRWRALVNDEAPWKMMCTRRGYESKEEDRQLSIRVEARSRRARLTNASDAYPGALVSVMNLWNSSSVRDDALPGSSNTNSRKGKQKARAQPSYQATQSPIQPPFSYRKYFKTAHLTESNWRHSGRLLRSHRSQDAVVVTSLAMDGQWIVVGLNSNRVHVFSASSGVLARTLIGHAAGVWSLWLVSKGGGVQRAKAEPPEPPSEAPGDDSWASMLPQSLRAGIGLGTPSSPAPSLSSSSSSSSSGDMPFQSVFDSLRPPPGESGDTPTVDESCSARQSDPCNASSGWGQTNALVISGGCDKQIRVWDVKSGYCLYVLFGHRSTIRCIKVFHGRPVAVSGSRDRTLRVWDVQKGTLLRTLEGHTDSVRCLDVFGNKVVSGSYDCTVRLWDVDTGECLRVFNGHYHQVYTVAFDGERIASGGLDTTVRIWSASTGSCLALLQGHTALVCQLQLSSRTNTVLTGSSDGRIIIFGIAPVNSNVHNGTSNRRLPVASLTESDLLASPPSSPPASNLDDRDERATDATDSSEYRILTRVPAHSSSVTGLQFNDRPGRQWVVSGGNDGRVQLWEVVDKGSSVAVSQSNDAAKSSSLEMKLIRDLTEPCEGLWRVAFRGDLAVICCLRAGRTVLEIWSFRPVEEDL